MTKKALVLGVDDYEENPLNGCVNDANRIAAILGAPPCGYEVKLLTNSDVTRAAVRSNVQWLLKDATFSLLYFAGHGWRTAVSTCLVTHDSTDSEEGVDFPWLMAAMGRLAVPNQSVLLVLDCCHSGDATPRERGVTRESITSKDLVAIGGTGRAVIAACRGSELALECIHLGTVHGAFTHYFCEAIEGAAASDDSRVTLNAVFDYVSSKLETEGRQIPVLRGDQEGSIIIANGVSKVGTWAQSNAQKLPLSQALERAEEYVTDAHRAISGGSTYERWQNGEYADACRRFEPMLQWFRRRVAVQSDLLSNSTFKQHFNSIQYFYEKLCSFGDGFQLSTGKVLNRIGSGGFGTVWRMDSTAWSHQVCFKSFHPNDLLDGDKVSRFRRGYEAMRQLDHPNIVKVRALSELPLGFYMDYVDGPNLRTLSPGAALEPEHVVDILLEVAETLKHAHGRGVIHRDVKPENILVQVTSNGEYIGHLTDFDLAWFSTATQVTKMAEGFGSHFYAAPEQINSPQSIASHRSTVDSYSFGQLCFFAVCNRDPQAFDHDNNAKVLADELGGRWSDAEASKEFLRLYVDCTRRNPKDRLHDFREVSDRLAVIVSALSKAGDEYDAKRFMQQLGFNISGKFQPTDFRATSLTLRSRSGRTEITLIQSKDAPKVCAIDITLRPNDLIMSGHKSSSARTLVNQRIDSMLRDSYKFYSAERKGAKGGAFEITVKVDHLSKDMKGVLKAREIVTRVVDLLEQA